MMPKTLLIVRHGQSEGNVVQKNESLAHLTADIPDNELRLTPLGVEQAEAAGEWLRGRLAELSPETVEGYCSTFVRTFETAGHLGLGLNWRPYPFIIERNWGQYKILGAEEQKQVKAMKRRNPLHAPMPNGQTLMSLMPTNYIFFSMLHRVHSEDVIVAVCHGERILTMRYLLERMTDQQFGGLMRSNRKSDRVRNCQTLEYSRINPENGDEAESFQWMRSVCPWEIREKDLAWKPIQRRRFGDADLLAYAQEFPRNLDA